MKTLSLKEKILKWWIYSQKRLCMYLVFILSLANFIVI